MRIVTYNVNGINGRLTNFAGVAGTGRAGYRLSSGAKSARRKVSGSRRPRRQLWRSLAWAKRLERRRNPGPWGARPVEIRRGLPSDPDDTHSRYDRPVLRHRLERRA
jgi:exodeoxyribonuclease-3